MSWEMQSSWSSLINRWGNASRPTNPTREPAGSSLRKLWNLGASSCLFTSSSFHWSLLPPIFRTYQTPWTPPRSRTSWACIPCVTATGTSRPRALPAATAFTRAWTGWPINWRTRNKQPGRHTFCLFWGMRVPLGRRQQDSGVGVIIGLWFPVSYGSFAFGACWKQTLHLSCRPFSHRCTSGGREADVGAVRSHESTTVFLFLFCRGVCPPRKQVFSLSCTCCRSLSPVHPCGGNRTNRRLFIDINGFFSLYFVSNAEALWFCMGSGLAVCNLTPVRMKPCLKKLRCHVLMVAKLPDTTELFSTLAAKGWVGAFPEKPSFVLVSVPAEEPSRPFLSCMYFSLKQPRQRLRPFDVSASP